MAIEFITDKPNELLSEFRARINQTEASGKITTWVEDEDAFTHLAKDWHKKAWFEPIIESDRLRFVIVHPKDQTISVTTYGYYHGHLTETFLNHFQYDFTSAHSSALAEAGDRVAP